VLGALDGRYDLVLVRIAEEFLFRKWIAQFDRFER
jgi:hypothetical protein